MRSGGPKLFCSPYFSMAVSLVLLIMTIKYYSLSSQYDDLLLKVSVFQNQLKLTASNMRNLDASLTRKEDSLNECIDEKKTVMERSNNLERDMDTKIADLANMRDANDDASSLVKKLKENIVKCSHDNSTMLEELKYLRRRNEELSRNEKECETNKAKINELELELNTLRDKENSELQAKDAEISALQGELNTLKEKSSDLHAQHLKLKQDFDNMKNQPSGQLPDLNPGKVSIRQPALNGIIGHREPILPRGDPKVEKPKPELHLDAPIHDDNAVREEILREEEAKEEAKENETVEDENPLPLVQPNPKLNLEKAPEIHDLAEFPAEDQDKPKPYPHESFLAKKAKLEQKPATQSFLDLKLLKRDKDTDINENSEEDSDDDETEEQETETAVLKLPPNSDDNEEPEVLEEVKNNLQILADDQIKDYEEDFPNDKEKRDPALILQDPLARDQDNADLISDSIQNGHQWRNKLMP